VIYAPGVRRPRPDRRPALAALSYLLAGALLLAGCGSGSSVASPYLPGQAGGSGDAAYNPTHHDFAEVRAMLARRAAAVRHHDEQGFMATVDDLNHDLVAQQHTLFENLSQLSISSLHYVVDPSSVLVPAAVAGDDPTFRPDVIEFLQIAGTMQHPVSNELEQTFVERKGHWVVGAETAAKDNDAFDSAQERPWFGVPIVARRDGPMTVLVDKARASTLGTLTSAIHDDIGVDASLLGIQPSYAILVDATSNGNATTFSSLSSEQAAAVTFALSEADPKDTSSFKALAGHAIKINPHQSGTYADDTGLLRHELTHFLLHEYTGNNPKWLVEGIATWVQYYPDDFSGSSIPDDLYHRVMSADRALPVVGLFDDDPDVNYQIAQASVTWLVRHYGMPKLIELMKAYQTHYQGANVDALTPRLLRLVYGIDGREVVAGAFQLLSEYQH
jgi:hypothetical protein